MVFYIEDSTGWGWYGFCSRWIDEPLELEKGLNFVGFPRPIQGLEFDSDLWNLSENIIGIVTEVDQVFHVVGDVDRAAIPFLAEVQIVEGLSEEAEITNVRSYLLFLSKATTLDLEAAVNCAPGVQRVLTATWGAIKKRYD